MRPEFFAIQALGATLSLAGVACLAALPLPDYRWYNRLAVLVLMGPITCLLLLVDLGIHRPVDPLGFAVGSLFIGLPLAGILVLSLRDLPSFYPEARVARVRMAGVWLAPFGMGVQLVPALLSLFGVHVA